MNKRTKGIAAVIVAAAAAGGIAAVRHKRKKDREQAAAVPSVPAQTVHKGESTVKKKARSALRLVLMLVFVGSLVMMALHFRDYRAGESDYQDAAELAGVTEESMRQPSGDASGVTSAEASSSGTQSSAGSSEGASSSAASSAGEQTTGGAAGAAAGTIYDEKPRNIDLNALRRYNSDVIGWISIPRTDLSYPVMQTVDNEYYLTHTWKNNRNKVGAIFMECTNAADYSDFHTLVYGHNMSDGSMFGSLKQYKTYRYWSYNPYVYTVSDSGTLTWKIFSVYEVSTESLTYRVDFAEGGDEAKQEFLDFCISQSTIETGVTPTVSDRILTLSTCTGQNHVKRFVVQAMLVE